MPKARQTCTRCSMRRQKCDRKEPCTRCVQNNDANSCSRKWPHNYDPKIHRSYPKSKAVQSRLQPYPPGSDVAGGVQDGAPAAPFARNAPTLQSKPQEQYSNNQTFLGRSIVNKKTQEAPPQSWLSRAGIAPTSIELLSGDGSLAPYVFNSDSILSPTNPDINNIRSGSNPEGESVDICPVTIQRHYLQTLLPTARLILQLVDYHNTCLLWYHRCVHGPTFRSELLKILEHPDGLQLKLLDLRWGAVLFSLMSASLTCTSNAIAHSWGFSKAEKSKLSRQWYKASISCLYLADYTSNIHVYSIQAIQALSMPAHILGFSNEQFVYLGAALRIAQSLGLQRLARDIDLDGSQLDGAPILQGTKDTIIKREMGRRIWTQLCIQDWFSTPASDMYSINKLHFTTIKPNRFDEETMGLVGDDVLVGNDFGNYFYDIASVAADFHDSVTCSVTLAAKYEQVLKYDSIMRAVGTEAMPRSLSFTEVTEMSKPKWARWARGTANIVVAHKVIMIHRNFLSKSFTDPRFAYTRWASIAASKTILREFEIASADAEKPMIWTDQAFMVAAGITLCLDMLHRTEAEPEFLDHLQLVEKAIHLLRQYDDSTLALRGVRLLSSLLTEARAKNSPAKYPADYNKNNRSNECEGDPPTWPENRHRIETLLAVNGPNSIVDDPLATAPTAVSERVESQARSIADPGDVDNPLRYTNYFDQINAYDGLSKPNGNTEISWTDLFSGFFPAQTGFDSAFLFEDFFT